MVVLCLALGVVFGMKKFLSMDSTEKSNASVEATDGNTGAVKVNTILPEDSGNSFEALTGETTETLPVGESSMPPMDGEGLQPPAPAIDSGIAALHHLEKFIAMKSLDERMPYIESKLSEAELASSVLNGPLPEQLKIEVDLWETNSLEQVVDHYYKVDFADADGGVNSQTMLVRMRGDALPKVVVDPFLDLFGGRFEKYASEPVKEAGTFQVIISAGAYCYDDIPRSEKKFTLKILAQEDNKEIAKAYFGKQSKIGAMLNDESSGLAYAQAKACTVFMRWNMDEDPERPFLEALDITSLNWNP
jgi:hypothetical protein